MAFRVVRIILHDKSIVDTVNNLTNTDIILCEFVITVIRYAHLTSPYERPDLCEYILHVWILPRRNR